MKLAQMLVRGVRQRVFSDRYDYRMIKFGIAAGMSMPINRHTNVRLELGLYEIGIARYFARLVQSAKVGYDVGSAFGYYVLGMVKHGVETIYAFEADPGNVRSLHETLTRNHIAKRVQVVNCSVGTGRGANACSIDGLIRDGALRPPDFVKMDIEGSELEALEGMEETTAQARPSFIVEVHSLKLEEQCTSFFASAGYRIRVVDNGSVLSWLFPETRSGHNRWLVSCHRSRSEAVDL